MPRATPLCAVADRFDLNNLVSYDAETQTAIFCLQGDGMKMSGAQPGAQHTYTLTLGAIVPEAHELTFTLPQNALSQPISRTETIDHPIGLASVCRYAGRGAAGGAVPVRRGGRHGHGGRPGWAMIPMCACSSTLAGQPAD